MGDVTLKLARPLSPHDARTLGIEERDYNVNDTVIVTRDWAQSLINAGLVQVDPEDRQAVDQALGRTRRPVDDAARQAPTKDEAAVRRVEGTGTEPQYAAEPTATSGNKAAVAADREKPAKAATAAAGTTSTSAPVE